MKRQATAAGEIPFPRLSMAAWILIWLVWTGGEPAGWIIGLPMLAGAFLLLQQLGAPRLRLSAVGLARLIGFFLFESLRGGWDVARRALRRDMRLCPDLHDYDTRLCEGPARVFLINCISLMPGTATVEREEGHLKLHVLDDRNDYVAEVRALESRVATIFADCGPRGDGGRA